MNNFLGNEGTFKFETTNLHFVNCVFLDFTQIFCNVVFKYTLLRPFVFSFNTF